MCAACKGKGTVRWVRMDGQIVTAQCPNRPHREEAP